MDDQLYDLARKRVDNRNRSWILLGADVFAFFIFVAAFASLRNFIPHDVGVFISIVWIGLMAVHAILTSVMQNRSSQIDAEVERLRSIVYEEKPKRLQLEDDGELVEAPETTDELPTDKTHTNRL